MPVTISGSGPIAGVTSLNTTVSDTELGYLDGVTSALQTQLGGKGTISTNGAWTAWTPALTAATTNPTLGTGSVTTGTYLQIGKMIIAKFKITFGTSGVAAGTGEYRVSLPIAASGDANGFEMAGGSVFLYDSSTAAAWTTAFYSNATSTTIAINYGVGGTLASVTNAAPWTWAASDRIWGGMIYEAA